MSDKPSQPTQFYVRARDGVPVRGYLRLNCGGECTVPLCGLGPRGDGITTPKQWGWDGNVVRPTITPSINCERCGWHKTITKGVAT